MEEKNTIRLTNEELKVLCAFLGNTGLAESLNAGLTLKDEDYLYEIYKKVKVLYDIRYKEKI